MAGIYIHIPFCKKACNYCDFHFSTSLKYKTKLVDCIVKEIDLRKTYILNQPINTIYFGGGTPSLLKTTELDLILNKIYKSFSVSNSPEITLEANPDDLTPIKIKELKNAGINRLSIGVQSIYDADLQFMNRAHTAAQSLTCIKNVQEIGIENISIDLIYGSPNLTNELWLQELEQIAELDIPHISSYALTVEQGTALAHDIKTNKIDPLNELKAGEQFQILIDFLVNKGYEHYEISNFCKPGKYSQHNTAYWQQKHYLGLGPSAHSYNCDQRSWNVSNNLKYIKCVENNLPFQESESLTEKNKFNEYIMTSLRTQWGIDEQYLKTKFLDLWNSLDYQSNLTNHLKKGDILKKDNIFVLSNKGKLLADKIISNLFAN